MKVLIVTDSHNQLNDFYKIIEIENPDEVIWTGDHSSNGDECSAIYENIKFHIVRGNCDAFDNKYNDDEILDLNGLKILITHGHNYGVKLNMLELELVAKKLEVDAVCFGHTHQPYYEEKNKIKYFNPGALKDKCYGILIIEDRNFEFKFKNIK